MMKFLLLSVINALLVKNLFIRTKGNLKNEKSFQKKYISYVSVFNVY